MYNKYQVTYLYNSDLSFLSNLVNASLVLIKESDVNTKLIKFLEKENINYEIIKEVNYKLLNLKNETNLEIALSLKDEEKVSLVYYNDELNEAQLKNSLIDGLFVLNDKDLLKAKTLASKIFFNPQGYDLFIVDFDGTIIDSMQMWETVCYEYLEQRKVTITPEFFKKVFSKTNREIAILFRDEFFKDETLEEVEKSLFDFIGNKYEDCHLKLHAKDLLKALKNEGKVILYSATALPLILSLVKRYHLESYYDGIYSGSELNLSKADGSGFVYFKEKYQAKNVMVIEDALHAIEGASKVNFDILAVNDCKNKNDYAEILKRSKYFISLDRKWI